MRKLISCICLILISGLTAVQSAWAEQSSSTVNTWQVVEIKGNVSIRPDRADDWYDASPGSQIESPFFVRTGNDSRVVLHHRKDEITVASNSVIKFEAERDSPQGIVSKIVQSVGYSIFKIEKNSGRRNVVETPFLVSVVKGTTFTVHSDETRATVNLIEGRLEVDLPDNSQARIITTGQIALFSKGDNGISVIDISGNVVNSAGRPVNLPANAGAGKSNSDKNNSANENRLNKGMSGTKSHAAEQRAINATLKGTVRSVNANSNANIPLMPGHGAGHGPGNNPGNGNGGNSANAPGNAGN